MRVKEESYICVTSEHKHECEILRKYANESYDVFDLSGPQCMFKMSYNAFLEAQKELGHTGDKSPENALKQSIREVRIWLREILLNEDIHNIWRLQAKVCENYIECLTTKFKVYGD